MTFFDDFPIPEYRAYPFWSIDQKIVWLRRREYLRNNPDAWIPESRSREREYHRWWHTKGKKFSLKHYTEGAQQMH